jgi:uncharacterized SAM-binding protein YcdF (DUF218 family)
MIAAALLSLGAVWLVRTFVAPEPGRRRGPLLVGTVVALGLGLFALPEGLVLQKVLGRLLLPLGLVWTALVATSIWRLGHRDRRGAGRAFSLAVLVTVCGNQFLGECAMAWLEQPYRTDPFSQGSFDVVVVLGGGTKEAPHPRYELHTSGDRVLLGARLYRAQLTPTLVTTGTAIEALSSSFDGTVATTQLWRELGVHDAAIVALGETRTTRQEAVELARAARAHGWRRIGLVTSAWHMRRAERLCRAAGVDVVPLAADHLGVPVWHGLYSLVPVGYGAWLQQKAVWELLGAAIGR